MFIGILVLGLPAKDMLNLCSCALHYACASYGFIEVYKSCRGA